MPAICRQRRRMPRRGAARQCGFRRSELAREPHGTAFTVRTDDFSGTHQAFLPFFSRRNENGSLEAPVWCSGWGDQSSAWSRRNTSWSALECSAL